MHQLLPFDIHLLILDHIKLNSDLKALCLVSKTWRDIVLPRLHRDVILDVCNKSDTVKFGKLHLSGGTHPVDAHEYATRSLTLLHNLLLLEAYSTLPGHLNFDGQISHLGVRKWDIMGEIDRLSILRTSQNFTLIPKNSLHTFRFLSNAALPSQILKLLYECHSDTLQHLHITLGSPIGFYPGSLRTLDILIRDDHWELYSIHEAATVELFLNQFQNRRLERMCIIQEHKFPPRHDDPDYIRAAIKKRENAVHLDSLRELSLTGFDLEPIEKSLLHGINLHHLSSLTLWKCQGMDFLFDEMVKILRGNNLNLKHLAIKPRDGGNLSGLGLDTILKSVPKIQSFCLDWSGCELWGRDALVKNIGKMGGTLRVLFLCDVDCQIIDFEHKISAQQFATICSFCPHLEQLGYQVFEDTIRWGPGVDLLMKSIGSLPSLKTLYLPIKYGVQSDTDESDRETPEPIEECLLKEKAFLFQRFSNELFNTLSSHSLRNLIIGSEVRELDSLDDLDDDIELEDDFYTHCFIRGTQKDIWGRSVEVGVAVPSYRLRAEDIGVIDWVENARDP